METELNFDPFLAFEQASQIDLQALFTEEASVLLRRDADGNLADDIIAKTDNLLATAEGMLEYSKYLEVVKSVATQCDHDHMRELMHNHGFDLQEDHEENRNKNKKKRHRSLGWIGVFISLYANSK